MGDNLDEFERKLCSLLNCLNLEAPSNTPDFALARYLRKCLESYNEAALVADGGCRVIPAAPDIGFGGTADVVTCTVPNSASTQEAG